MTAVIRQAAFNVTGDVLNTCPWRSYHRELVQRVLAAASLLEKGALQVHEPEPSHRTIEGLDHYIRARNRSTNKKLDEQLAEAQKQGGRRVS